jgi:putative nucleotidyltransferase with HDIG domain
VTKLRPALRLFVAGSIAAGALAAVIAFAVAQRPTQDALVLAGILLLIATTAQLFPLHLSMKLKVTAEDTATYAAALLLDPFLAIAVSCTAKILGLRFRTTRMSWYNRAFNAATAVLETAAAALAFHALDGGTPSLTRPLPLIAAALAKYLVNTGLVTIAVDLQMKRRPLSSWWSGRAHDMRQSAALYLFGGLAATNAEGQPWIFFLFAVPMALVFLTTRETARLREQTRAVILELADLIDLRDPYTHGHSQRVAALAERLAKRLRLDPVQIELVRDAARVHDIGKIGTNDLVLLKPAALSAEEKAEMERHAELGHRLLRRLPEFWQGAELVLSHHERVDGRGYPRGLAGNEVPIEASVIAVADTYDAMTTDRPYRRALPWEYTRAELLRERGRQWHAIAVDAFVAMIDEERLTEARPTVAADVAARSAGAEPAGALRGA